jgi:8-oxo-dGTP pyrophosphatase MutT (NUDIX family)
MEETVDLARLRAELQARKANELTGDWIKRRAAVSAILRQADPGLEVLLIRRAEREGDLWSGHMAFPGGRSDPADSDLLETAIRETKEEVGVDLAVDSELLGRLDEVPVTGRGLPVGLALSPYVFFLTHAGSPIVPADPAEVAEVLWAPLAPMLSGATATTYPFMYEGRQHDMPAFDVQGHIVWGLTYRMLISLFELFGHEP